MIPLPPPDHEQTMEAIAACGVAAANIRISYENDLQSDVIRISDLGPVDGEKLQCLRQAVHPFYVLEIEDADQRNAFYAFTDRVDRQQARAEAVAWLEERGLIGRVPRYDPAEGMEAFARAIEAACGLTAGTALEAYGSSYLSPRREYLEALLKSGSQGGLACLQRYLAASNADEHGIRLVVIGYPAMGGHH